MKEMKNMAYWKAKSGIVTPAEIPGINHNSEGNTDLPDGRSGFSPFQQKKGKELKETKPGRSKWWSDMKKGGVAHPIKEEMKHYKSGKIVEEKDVTREMPVEKLEAVTPKKLIVRPQVNPSTGKSMKTKKGEWKTVDQVTEDFEAKKRESDYQKSYKLGDYSKGKRTIGKR